VIGILGGMGPLATADLYQKIIQTTPAATDQEHIPVVIHADPRVPDRTEALLRDGEDPTPWLVHGARVLCGMGADFIVMPCNTAHAFLDAVQPAVDRPILSMIDAAADEIRANYPGETTVGLLATSGTISAELYQMALTSRGVDVIVPDDDIQRRCVMAAIREVKAGRAGRAATALLTEAAQHLTERGANVLLAACTEIPVIFEQRHTQTPLVDATSSLARIAVATAIHLDEAARTGTPQWETSTAGWGIEPAKAAGL
jgi:aspartate racemase